MRLTSIDVYSNGLPVAALSFKNPSSSNPYNTTAIDGLDAEEVTAKFYGLAVTSKKKQYNLSLPERDVTLHIALNPDFAANKSYSDLRDDLYKAVYSSRTGLIELRFKDDAVTKAVLYGFVSKFESPRFTKTPEVNITIRCPEPMLKAPTRTDISVVGLGSTFTITDSLSTAPHGMKFDLTFNADTATFVMKDSATPEWAFTLNPVAVGGVSGFKNNDHLYVSSESGDKSVYLIRSGTTYPLADKIVPGSSWPLIFPLANTFVITTGVFTWGAMSHVTTYWGA